MTAGALILMASLIACAGPALGATPSLAGTNAKALTIGQLADYFIQAADDYNPDADRAAQFSPFAALSGYDAAIRETARQTDRRIELGEDERELLNEKLRLLMDTVVDRPAASFTIFVPDERKEGGSYTSVSGFVKQVDAVHRTVLLTGGREIPIEDVYDIECELFDQDI